MIGVDPHTVFPPLLSDSIKIPVRPREPPPPAPGPDRDMDNRLGQRPLVCTLFPAPARQSVCLPTWPPPCCPCRFRPVVPQRRIQRGCRHQRHAGHIVYELGVNVLAGRKTLSAAVLAYPTLSCAPASVSVYASFVPRFLGIIACHSFSSRALLLASFAFFAPDIFAFVPNPFAFVRLGLPDRADFGRHGPDPFLVDAFDTRLCCLPAPRIRCPLPAQFPPGGNSRRSARFCCPLCSPDTRRPPVPAVSQSPW